MFDKDFQGKLKKSRRVPRDLPIEIEEMKYESVLHSFVVDIFVVVHTKRMLCLSIQEFMKEMNARQAACALRSAGNVDYFM